MHSAAWRYGTTSGCKKLEGRLNGLDADMQQPTACRKDEGRMPLREAAQLGVSRLGSHACGSEARGGGEEGSGLVGGGARLRKGTRKKSQS